MTEENAAAKGGWVAYRPEIKILDCTIRDGGLTCDHKFNDEMVKKIYNILVASGVDYMELGYKCSQKIYAKDEFGDWKFCEEDSLRRIVDDNPSDMKLTVMADAERTDYKTDIGPKSESVIDAIRVACYIHQIPTAIDMVKDAVDKGYEAYLQLMAASTVKTEDLRKALEIGAQSEAGSIYLVDSFGSMYGEQIRDMTKMYLEIVEGTGKDIGFHGHNNMQLAFANTIEAIVNGANRLDATISGIGRGAGNCPLELLLGFLHNPKFKIRPVLEAIQDIFVPLSKEVDWGYSVPYALTGQLNQHPREAIKWRAGDNPDNCMDFYDLLREED
jgi:4-hydroxy 2-oxovalerate aldolase